MNNSSYWDLHARGAEALYEAKLEAAEATFAAARREAETRRLFGLADRAYCNWAATRLERGQPSGLREGLSRVLGSSDDPKARQLASYYLANLYRIRGPFRGARFYAEMSRRLAESLGDRPGQASTTHLLGLLCVAEDRFDLAEDYLHESLKISVKDGTHPSALITICTLGYCLCLAGNMNESLWLLEEARETITAPGCKFYEPDVRLNLGFAYLEWGDLDDAIEQGQTALTLLGERESSEAAKFGYYLTGEAHAQMGAEREAREYFGLLQKTFYPQYSDLADLLLSLRTSRWINWLGL